MWPVMEKLPTGGGVGTGEALEEPEPPAHPRPQATTNEMTIFKKLDMNTTPLHFN
jgi:hypothetical protein